jgi:hypothetical protein
MSFASSASATVEIVATTVKCIERYVADQQDNPDQLLAASSLLALCQCILAALHEIQNSLHLDGWDTESTDDGSLQSLSSVLVSCQITFKILLDMVQHDIPTALDAAPSSARARDLWLTSEIEVLSQNISKIASGLQLLIQTLNLYGSICYHLSL